MNALFSISSSALPATVVTVGLRGVEAISAPYRFEVGFVTGADFDMGDAVGARATLTLDRGAGKLPLLTHGVLAALELLHELSGSSLYLATLVPHLWHLSLSLHSRVYTDASIPQIIEAVLKSNGFLPDAYAFRLGRSYKPREHVCQYRESDLDFISRWMEREGMYYFFEQGAEREVLVIMDDRAFQGQLVPEPVTYFPLAGDDASSGIALRSFTSKHTTLPSKVRLRDYDYSRPSLALKGSASVASGAISEIVSYGDNLRTPEEGELLAALRAEELRARQVVFHGKGPVLHLRAGYTFALEDHPRPSFNAEYLTVALEHRWSRSTNTAEFEDLLGLTGGATYAASVTAIPADVQFRAERKTPWPRIDSVVEAVIDGKQGGPYAEIDSQGRYKTRIYFDESDLVDGSASTWVRMLQPHGGSTEGFHFPLRKGTEVHLVFLGGDPDRPVIVGVAHNMHKPSVVTMSNHTTNVIQTGGANRVEMGDLAGGQYVTVSTPSADTFVHLGAGGYQLVLHTDGDAHFDIAGNLDIEVGGDMTEDVTGSVTETYLSTQTTAVTGAVTQNYDSTLDLTVTGAVTHVFDATLDESVTGAVKQTYSSTLDLSVTAAVTESLQSTLDQTVTGNVTVAHGANQSLEVKGSRTEKISGSNDTQIDGSSTLTIAGKLTGNVGGPVEWNCPKWTVNAGPTEWFDPHDFKVTGLSIGVTGASFGWTGLSNSATDLSIGLTDVSLSNTGMSLSATGMSLSATGISASYTGLDLTAAGPDVVVAAIIILM